MDCSLICILISIMKRTRKKEIMFLILLNSLELSLILPVSRYNHQTCANESQFRKVFDAETFFLANNTFLICCIIKYSLLNIINNNDQNNLHNDCHYRLYKSITHDKIPIDHIDTDDYE